MPDELTSLRITRKVQTPKSPYSPELRGRLAPLHTPVHLSCHR